MKLIVNPHTTELEPSLVNEKEVNITQIEIEYNDIPTDYVKDVYFTLNEETYTILNVQNTCTIPPEVLKEKGTIEIGIVISEIMGDELIARYNPSPSYFDTLDGSLKDTYENSEPITPTDKEQMEQALQNGLNDIEQAITNAERLDVDVSKQEHTTTVSITKQDGTTKSENVDDGIGLLYQWQGTRLGVKRENDISYEYADLQGPQGQAGTIRMLIVNELPLVGETGVLYFVPKQETETKDLYDEYTWLNGAWELLGEKQITIDLSDYYTKQETNTLLDGKADISDIPDLTNYVKNTDYATPQKDGIIKAYGTYGVSISTSNAGGIYPQVKTNEQYTSASDNLFISKGTLENVITGKELVNKTYVDTLIGDIDSALDLINGESVGV